jgi:hypothetical protein
VKLEAVDGRSSKRQLLLYYLQHSDEAPKGEDAKHRLTLLSLDILKQEKFVDENPKSVYLAKYF